MVTLTSSQPREDTRRIPQRESAGASDLAATAGDNIAPEDFRGRRVHFIGIGGSGMCGLAQMLKQMGANVSGSDKTQSAATDKLVALGVKVGYQQTAESFPQDAEYVVYSAAIRPDHPELCSAQCAGARIFKYAQTLGRVMQIKNGIAIAGTHGKSTTTSMVAYILLRAGIDPSYIIGASSRQLNGSAHGGTGKYFVAEACEYDRSFLNLHPRLAAVLNVEPDHLDYYHDLRDITQAFGQFIAQVEPGGVIITNGENAACMEAARAARAPVETYGLTGSPDWLATEIQSDHGKISYTVSYQGRFLGRLALCIPGRHNIGNSMVAAAIARHCEIPWEVIVSAIEEFSGADRRSELLGQINGITVLDDYAHHPTEIRSTLSGLRELYQPRRLICVFQPHQHSRTRCLMDEFAASFSDADLVIVPDIYFARDTEADRQAVHAQNLVNRIVANGRLSRYIPTFPAVVAALRAELQSGDLVVSMGAGPVWEITHELVCRLQEHCSH
ncbi:MAG: UDP-N-acetylmuramate--L-alanine ligase [Planctomycetes bacterium]|nr:UDP-N-acetylmuramate--L-alanine ligase [Planctomycetota bacterium]